MAAKPFRRLCLAAAMLLLAPHLAHSRCPLGLDNVDTKPEVLAHAPETSHAAGRTLMQEASAMAYNPDAISRLDLTAVKQDLAKLLTDSKDFWPADFGNYGPLMIRLAWHCAGSYRLSDGRGGCDGGRIRHDPERSWPDNTNLDKARTLLWPIKQKYGNKLTWADLIALSGTVAIESMGGPYVGFCAGRMDDTDGTDSLELGPSDDQMMIADCPDDGNCTAPLGATTMGLIYVNPEGPMGNPVPELSAPQIRDTFARMGMNDSETVALVGGGHAFGKVHGACTTGPGPSPKEDPANPWPGTCGTGALKGKGPNTFTSGFEGPWSTTPTVWSNQYFTNLLEFDWELHKGPGGLNQWRPVHKPGANKSEPVADIMMLTADVALTKDPEYLKLVELYASDLGALTRDFGEAWYKLMTRDMGPHIRCLGEEVPPARPWQNPLPPPPRKMARMKAVKAAVADAMVEDHPALEADQREGKSTYAALFANLAWQCASTFRKTDYAGGCNGGYIRFPPQKDWPSNVAMDKVLEVLAPVKEEFGSRLSWADLIVMAGNVGVETLSSKGIMEVSFCPGRSDALDGSQVVDLKPRVYVNTSIVAQARDGMKIMGLTPEEHVALAARPRSASQQRRLGFSGSWARNGASVVSNAYFKVLLNEEWVETTSPAGNTEYKAEGKDIYMTPHDMAIRWDSQFLAIAQDFATLQQQGTFLRKFAKAWAKVMNADRFHGPTLNACEHDHDDEN